MTRLGNRRINIGDLPVVRGRYVENADMSAVTWFRVGGPADVLYTPDDEEDLSSFLSDLAPSIPIFPVGVGSNLLVRDGGVRGVVIRLGAPFAKFEIADAQVTAGAAAFDASVARRAAKAGIGGLEFYRGIPGTIGGALRMNAGAYGTETKDVLIDAVALDRAGNRHVFTNKQMDFSYRHSRVAPDLIFTQARFKGHADCPEAIQSRMNDIMTAREASQPIRERTGGSTFANPDPTLSGGKKSWQLIDFVGGRGRRVGGAQVSEQHCNFMINKGTATAADLESLIEGLRIDVENKTGVKLRWEIKRIGNPL